MIFDPKISALYASDGTFIKSLHCPMALRVQDLDALPEQSPQRHCHSCDKTILCIDSMTDAEVQHAAEEDESLCVFATSAAKHVIFLKPVGSDSHSARAIAAVERLPTIWTARTLESMSDAFMRGYRPLVKRVGVPGEIGAKFIVFQHKMSGELWWSADFRRESPPTDFDSWTLVADWFRHRPDQPFPLAAYLVPPALMKGQRVLLDDLIEDVGEVYWNQGDSNRMMSGLAVWNGEDFELEEPLDLPTAAVG